MSKVPIKYFVLSVYDQDRNTIQDMADYFMHIQFIIEYNRDKYIILGYILDIINKMYNYSLSKL